MRDIPYHSINYNNVGGSQSSTDGMSSLTTVVLTTSIAAAAFVLDLSLPLGVAGGVPYVALVLMGIFFSKTRHTYFLAVFGSMLTIIGYFTSPEGGVYWVVLANRGLALFAIWITAFLIASRKRFEDKLRSARDNLEFAVAERTEELRKLSQTVEQSPSMMIITDTDGVIEYANAKLYEVTGFSPDEIIGKTPRVIKSGNTPAAIYEELWRTIKAGKVWSSEIEDRRKDGSTFWADVTIAPIRSHDGVVTHYSAIHDNITMRKEAEKAMLKAREHAEVANRAKSDLMANMSHELRTPLNAIIGFSDMMKKELLGPVGNDKYREYLEDINSSGQHLLQLVNDVLDVSAIEASALELHEKNVSLSDIAEASIRLINPRADEGRVTVTSSIDHGIPLIYADKRRVKQVLLNLLSNAVKFTPEEGEVSVSSYLNADGSLAVTVSDTGIGMDEQEMSMALSTFGQVDSGLDRKHEGTGLGLPLTQKLVELHDGTIEIESEKDRGTTVTVTFPPGRIIRGGSAEHELRFG